MYIIISVCVRLPVESQCVARFREGDTAVLYQPFATDPDNTTDLHVAPPGATVTQ